MIYPKRVIESFYGRQYSASHLLVINRLFGFVMPIDQSRVPPVPDLETFVSRRC